MVSPPSLNMFELEQTWMTDDDREVQTHQTKRSLSGANGASLLECENGMPSQGLQPGAFLH